LAAILVAKAALGYGYAILAVVGSAIVTLSRSSELLRLRPLTARMEYAQDAYIFFGEIIDEQIVAVDDQLALIGYPARAAWSGRRSDQQQHFMTLAPLPQAGGE
jgi:hypothetical protein